MHALRSSASRWTVAAALTAFCTIAIPDAARAASVSYTVADKAVIQVIGRSTQIIIRTWNRNSVQIDWPDGSPFVPLKSVQQTRPSYLIPTVNVKEYETPAGPVMTTLLPEDFPVPGLPPGAHDVVRVEELALPRDLAQPPTNRNPRLTVTIPASTGLLTVRSRTGAITLSDYDGTTIAGIGHGRISFRNVRGDAFVQPLNGHFYALRSRFERLRVRSNHADEVFDECNVEQIEATTLTGNILFDNGTFDPGLAHFDSDRGWIALGVNGNAQLGAHTQEGHVFSLLSRTPEPLPGGSASDTSQRIGNGGPLVNASSAHGNVFLYDGSIANRRSDTLSPNWSATYKLLAAERAAEGRSERR